MNWSETITDYFDHYPLAATSRVGYGGELWRLGVSVALKPHHEVTEQDLVRFCRAVSSPGSQTKRRNILCSFFKFCENAGHVSTNPARNLRELVKPGVQGVKHHNWLARDQVTNLLLMTCHAQRDYVVLLLPLTTGLRRAEMAALDWKDVDLSQRELKVVGKGGKYARLGINDQLRTALSDLFTHEGRVLRLGPSGISAVVRKYGTMIGVPTLAPHDLRRTFADLLLKQTGDLLAVSRAMRHSNVGTTQRYLESSPRAVIETGKAFRL